MLHLIRHIFGSVMVHNLLIESYLESQVDIVKHSGLVLHLINISVFHNMRSGVFSCDHYTLSASAPALLQLPRTRQRTDKIPRCCSRSASEQTCAFFKLISVPACIAVAFRGALTELRVFLLKINFVVAVVLQTYVFKSFKARTFYF